MFLVHLQMEYYGSRKYCVYIIKCKDGSLYTGITNDIERRFEEHVQGVNKECYTYRRRPLELVFAEQFQYVNQAIMWEKRIKKWSRVKKWALINGDGEALKELSTCKNESIWTRERKL